MSKSKCCMKSNKDHYCCGDKNDRSKKGNQTCQSANECDCDHCKLMRKNKNSCCRSTKRKSDCCSDEEYFSAHSQCKECCNIKSSRSTSKCMFECDEPTSCCGDTVIDSDCECQFCKPEDDCKSTKSNQSNKSTKSNKSNKSTKSMGKNKSKKVCCFYEEQKCLQKCEKKLQECKKPDKGGCCKSDIKKPLVCCKLEKEQCMEKCCKQLKKCKSPMKSKSSEKCCQVDKSSLRSKSIDKCCQVEKSCSNSSLKQKCCIVGQNSKTQSRSKSKDKCCCQTDNKSNEKKSIFRRRSKSKDKCCCPMANKSDDKKNKSKSKKKEKSCTGSQTTCCCQDEINSNTSMKSKSNESYCCQTKKKSKNSSCKNKPCCCESARMNAGEIDDDEVLCNKIKEMIFKHKQEIGVKGQFNTKKSFYVPSNEKSQIFNATLVTPIRNQAFTPHIICESSMQTDSFQLRSTNVPYDFKEKKETQFQQIENKIKANLDELKKINKKEKRSFNLFRLLKPKLESKNIKEIKKKSDKPSNIMKEIKSYSYQESPKTKQLTIVDKIPSDVSKINRQNKELNIQTINNVTFSKGNLDQKSIIGHTNSKEQINNLPTEQKQRMEFPSCEENTGEIKCPKTNVSTERSNIHIPTIVQNGKMELPRSFKENTGQMNSQKTNVPKERSNIHNTTIVQNEKMELLSSCKENTGQMNSQKTSVSKDRSNIHNPTIVQNEKMDSPSCKEDTGEIKSKRIDNGPTERPNISSHSNDKNSQYLNVKHSKNEVDVKTTKVEKVLNTNIVDMPTTIKKQRIEIPSSSYDNTEITKQDIELNAQSKNLKPHKNKSDGESQTVERRLKTNIVDKSTTIKKQRIEIPSSSYNNTEITTRNIESLNLKAHKNKSDGESQTIEQSATIKKKRVELPNYQKNTEEISKKIIDASGCSKAKISSTEMNGEINSKANMKDVNLNGVEKGMYTKIQNEVSNINDSFEINRRLNQSSKTVEDEDSKTYYKKSTFVIIPESGYIECTKPMKKDIKGELLCDTNSQNQEDAIHKKKPLTVDYTNDSKKFLIDKFLQSLPEDSQDSICNDVAIKDLKEHQKLPKELVSCCYNKNKTKLKSLSNSHNISKIKTKRKYIDDHKSQKVGFEFDQVVSNTEEKIPSRRFVRKRKIKSPQIFEYNGNDDILKKKAKGFLAYPSQKNRSTEVHNLEANSKTRAKSRVIRKSHNTS